MVSQYLPSIPYFSSPPPPSLTTQIYNTLISNPIASTTALLGTAAATLTSTMSALLPLPLMSLLLLPAFTSYSTTLNLLFFYLMWSTLVLSHSPLKIEIAGTLLIRVAFYLLPATVFLAFDLLFPKAAINLKAQEEKGLPSPVVGETRLAKRLGLAKREKWWRIYGWTVFNILLSVFIQGAIDFLFTKVLKIRSALKVSTSLPMPWGIAKDLLRGFLLREILTYVTHRYALHDPQSPLTSLHTKWSHSKLIPVPYSLVAHYDHPAAYLLRTFIPTYAPALLFRFHLLTYLLYLTLTSLEEVFAFSGYSTVPTNFILGGIARRTDTHWLCKGEGNFAPLGLVDWAMGTSVGDDVLDDLRDEADKHDLNGKVDRAVEGAKKKGRDVRRRGARRVAGREDD